MNLTGINLAGALAVAVLIGAILPLQGLVNARLGAHVGGPVSAAFVSFLIGTVMLGLYLLATRTPVTLQGSLELPPWIWAGGVFGAIYVACLTLLIPRIGAAGMICLAVLGQVTASLAAGQLRRAAGTQAGRRAAHLGCSAGTGRCCAGGGAVAATSSSTRWEREQAHGSRKLHPLDF